MKEVLVKTLMTQQVNCLSPDATLREAAEQMVQFTNSCIIIKHQQAPVGILTERDLVRVLCSKSPEQELAKPVSDFMSSPVLSLNARESLFDALVVNRTQKVRHLPVVNDEDELVGLVTQSDLANAHFHVTELQSKALEEAIASKTRDLRQVNEELQALSMEDHLMEIGNRRAMEVDLVHTHASAIRYDQIYTVLLLDIDYFKRYNDRYGHLQGDVALKQVADIIRNSVRASDRLYRYGGEELLLILPNTPASPSNIVADKLVSAVRNCSVKHDDSPEKVLTISGGCASITANQSKKHTNWQDVVAAADEALYQAKSEGRNRAIVKLPK